MTMLDVAGLHVSYGRIEALRGVDLSVPEGGFVALLGANGAGKSTLLNTVIGVVRADAGTIRFQGQPIMALATAERIRLGIGIVPEGRQLFSDMTVRENLLLGGYARLRMWAGRSASRIAEVVDMFPELADKLDRHAGLLSGGEAQMVTIGRALINRPRLLLCDEPSLGLAPRLVRDVFKRLAALRDNGIAVLLADQNAVLALEVADQVYLLETGEATPAAASASLDSDAIRAAYLGAAPRTAPA